MITTPTNMPCPAGSTAHLFKVIAGRDQGAEGPDWTVHLMLHRSSNGWRAEATVWVDGEESRAAVVWTNESTIWPSSTGWVEQSGWSARPRIADYARWTFVANQHIFDAIAKAYGAASDVTCKTCGEGWFVRPDGIGWGAITRRAEDVIKGDRCIACEHAVDTCGVI